MVAAVLLILSSMLPQVLVTASHAMRNDRSRDEVLNAAECGVALAEARLKNDVAHALAAGQVAHEEGQWVVKPAYENPDFGHHARTTYEVKLVAFKFRGMGMKKEKEIYEFAYRLHAEGRSTQDTHANPGRKAELAVSGNLRATVSVDTGTTGVASRVVDGVEIHAFNEEL
jgi:hypothetical protein